jgi:transcriptional regulator with XRE-family HTH domain
MAKQFAKLVRAWRDARQLTRADAARKLGVPYRTLQDWEDGKRTPRGIARWLILDKLGLIEPADKRAPQITKRVFQRLMSAKYDKGS